MVLNQDPAESSRQDDGQAQTAAPGQPAAIQNADDEPEPQPQPGQGPHLEADVRTSSISPKFIDTCIVSRRRGLRVWQR